MSLYVGVNGTRKSVSSLFVGVNGVPKEVNELYVGENGNRKLVYQNINVDRDLGKINPIKLLNSGKITKDDIGKTVYLSNSNTTCQEWIIADVGHDWENDGTVDLVPKYVLGEDIDYGNGYYYVSNLRYWLNTSITAGFTDEIRAGMIELPFESHNTSGTIVTLTDYVKCPNLVEVGISGSTISGEGGYIYPIYGTAATNANLKSIMKNMSDTAVEYYTRGVCKVNGSYTTMETVTTSGSHNTNSYDSAAIGFIRFKGNKEVSIAKQLATVNPIDLLTSGKLDSTYIGRTVYISNPGSESQEWLIAGVNHDSTGHYSIDLVSKYIMLNDIGFGAYNDNNIYYHNSAARSAIRNRLCNNFSREILAHMGVFTYTSNGIESKDTLVAPTSTEVGLTSNSNEGTMYPLFGSSRVGTNSKAIRKRVSTNEPTSYWTRDTAGGNNANIITSTGICQSHGFLDTSSSTATDTYHAGITGLIRFVKYDSNMNIDYQLDNMIDPIEALTSGKISSADIGKTVCLSNSAFNSIEWLIADVNHDGTSGTIDLICKHCALTNTEFCSTSSTTDAVTYNNATMNKMLDKIYYGFDYRMRAVMTNMSFRCGSTTVSAKVKLPSLAEVGLTAPAYYTSTDGQKYPIFNSTGIILRDITGVNYNYWTRNTYTGYQLSNYNNATYVSMYGNAATESCNTNTGMMYRPIIRVKVQ